MARRARIHYPGALYHVMLRGNAKQAIFHGPADFARFEEILGQGLEKCGMRVCAFCWMPNHIHMAVQVSDIPLSKMMQVLSQRYTRWFNHRYDRVGHLFQGRYRAILVDSDGYLREIVRYIHLNPVRAGIVKDPMDYRESSHRAYVAISENLPLPVPWLTPEPALRQFGHTRETARAAYLHFMGQPEEVDLLTLLRQGGSHGHILGQDDFIDKARALAAERAERAESKERAGPGGGRPPELSLDLDMDKLAERVAHAWQLSVHSILSKSKSRPVVEARIVLALMAMDYCQYSLREVSRYLGRDESTIGRQILRLRGRIKKITSLRQKVNKLGSGLHNRH
jgi:putative transposase